MWLFAYRVKNDCFFSFLRKTLFSMFNVQMGVVFKQYLYHKKSTQVSIRQL